MRFLSAALHRVRSLLDLRRADRALDDELAFHLEMETSKLVAGGMSEAEARATAQRTFGGVARHRDEARDQRGISVIEDFVADLRHGVRSFARRPGFTAVVVLTLGVGIGTITSVFGTVYSVVLAPLPYQDASRVMVVWVRNVRTGVERDQTSPADFMDWRDRNRTFDRIAATEPWSFDYVDGDGPVSLNTALVSEGFFDIFRVRALVGRELQKPDYAPSAPKVAVLSENIWRTRFGADHSVVGRTLILEGEPRTIVGVMPAAFDLPHGEDVWAPRVFTADEHASRAGKWIGAVGLLREGVTVAQANADLNRVSLELAREYAATNADYRTWAEPIAATLFGPIQKTLFTLLGAAAFVLAIVCANTGALIVTRTLERDRELAVRVALGAGRTRLLRQLVAETAALAAAGGALGVFIAVAGTAMIRRLAPPDLPRLEEIGVSIPVFVFCAGVTIVTSLFAAIAAASAVRRNAGRGTSLIGAPTGVGRRTRWSRSVLVGAESALALVLVVGAGLLIRSYATVTSVDRGFVADGVLTTTVQAWNYYDTGEKRIAYVADVLTRLRALPGVSAVGTTSSLPLAPPIGNANSMIVPEGATAATKPTRYHTVLVNGDYFGAVGIGLRDGRAFGAADVTGSTPVVIVSESFARHTWPEGRAIGKRIMVAFQGRPIAREVVGVVGDVRQRSLEADPIASVYIPHTQSPTGAITFVIRGDNTAGLIPFFRRTLFEVNATMPAEGTTPFSQYVDGAIRERRFHLALLSAFAVVAVALAMLGIYGVTNQAATERTREIGLRVAVGATGADITSLILRQGATIASIGVAAGIVTALALTRLLRSLLFQVTPLDPLTFGSGITILLVIAIVASWIPARRASAIDPVRALRGD